MVTNLEIEKLADKVKSYLKENALFEDVCLYYNDKQETNSLLKENIKVKDHIKYSNPLTITITFDGSPLYNALTYGSGKVLDDLDDIAKSYNLYWDFGYSWTISAYSLDLDDKSSEDENEKIIDINCLENIGPKELCIIQEYWKMKSDSRSDEGSCVLGAEFTFSYKDINYIMPHLSCNQGSMTWEHYISDIKWFLEKIGCTDVIYDWGLMD